MARFNGGIIGANNAFTTSKASGVWSLNEVRNAVSGDNWPFPPPTPPDTVTAEAGDAEAIITFSGQVTYGNSPSFTVTSSPEGVTANGASSPITVTGLTNDTEYTFTVTVIDDGGSTTSSVSNAVTPAAAPFTATGGTITESGGYKIHTFTSSGTFEVTSAPDGSEIEYLVVAGGGGAESVDSGGNSRNYGEAGAGAGGLLSSTLTPTVGTYSIGIGAGGAVSTNGSDTTFGAITATGGGTAEASGGSGGGEDGITATSANEAGAGTAGQGNAGGQGTTLLFWAGAAGGGGGAGAVGGNASGSTGGSGGDGVEWPTGSGVYYAGGGGGGGGSGTTGNISGSNGSGGLGGGGAAGDGTGTNGTVNTGGGGGGTHVNINVAFTGGTGGSGIVIIRYLIG